jgi:hypothetical protein
MNEERRCSVLLALQVALLSAIPAHLRAVTARWTDTDVHFDCYFDGAITDDDEETMDIVETEAMAALPATNTVTRALHRLDFPARLPSADQFVFHRKEDWTQVE